MFTSTASKLSMLRNTEAFLSRFKWILNEEDCEDSEAAVIELESSQLNQSLTIDEMDIRIKDKEQEFPYKTTTEESPSVSPSESISCVTQSHCSMDQESIIIATEQESSVDLASFEVVQEGLNVEMCQMKNDPQGQNNGFGDTGDTTLKVYKPENGKSSSVKSLFSYFLEENGDGCTSFAETPNFQRDAIIIGGDILQTAVQGIKAGVSYLLGDQKNSYREDTVHYRGYKLRTKGMELFLDSMHAKNKCQPDEDESSVSERKVHFLFKLSNNNRFWQTKEPKKISSFPLKVYWLDQLNSTSMFVEVFDSEIELEMPIGIPKDSIVVACDPDQGTLSILAPFYPQ